MGYEETENRFETEEGLSADEVKVRGMLGRMKRVEAPRDFGFKVQARIANAKPEDFRANSWLPVLRYAAPLALVLVVTSAFIVNGVYNVNEASVPEVAGSQVTQPPMDPSAGPPGDEVAVRVPGSIGFTANSNSETNTLAANPRRSPLERRAGDSRESGGGFRDSASERPPTLIQPPGAESNTPGRPGEMGSRGQIPVRAVLEMVGVRADFSDLGWKVKSVDSNSVSERAGVKAGDLIEAINGLPVTDGTQFSGSFTGKNLRVKRDGKTVEIDLKQF